jgi:hypothetical protein
MNTIDIPLSTRAGQRRLSQNDIILRELQESSPSWVGLPRLMEISGSAAVHSRIADLRGRGHKIDHENDRSGDGRYISRYRFIFDETEK